MGTALLLHPVPLLPDLNLHWCVFYSKKQDDFLFLNKMNSFPPTYHSPNKEYKIDFILEGEVRFGPAYFTIKLNGELVQNRIFGYAFRWHPDSTFLALQEWKTSDYRSGPYTILTIIDLQNKKLARIAEADKGFIQPIRFEKNNLTFEKAFIGKGTKLKDEIDLNSVGNWEAL